MQRLLAIIAFVLLSVSASEGLAQTRSDELSKREKFVTELPESVLNTELQLLGGKTLKLSEYTGKVY